VCVCVHAGDKNEGRSKGESISFVQNGRSGSDRRRSSMDCQNLFIWNVRGLNSGFFFLPVALVFACCERVGLAVFAWLTGLAMLVI
jgi:hypothetical protein